MAISHSFYLFSHSAASFAPSAEYSSAHQGISSFLDFYGSILEIYKYPFWSAEVEN